MSDFFSDEYAYLHSFFGQAQRIKRSEKTKMISYDECNKTAVFEGSEGDLYDTELDYCSCIDFDMTQLPCKHIYALAIRLGKFVPPEADFLNIVDSLTVTELKFLTMITYGQNTHCFSNDKMAKKFVKLGLCSSCSDESQSHQIVMEKSEEWKNKIKKKKTSKK